MHSYPLASIHWQKNHFCTISLMRMCIYSVWSTKNKTKNVLAEWTVNCVLFLLSVHFERGDVKHCRTELWVSCVVSEALLPVKIGEFSAFHASANQTELSRIPWTMMCKGEALTLFAWYLNCELLYIAYLCSEWEEVWLFMKWQMHVRNTHVWVLPLCCCVITEMICSRHCSAELMNMTVYL